MTTDAPTQAPARTRRFSTTDLALIAAFGALVAVCSYIAAIPVVPQMTAADRKKQRSDAAGRSKPNEPASLFVSVRGDTAPAEDASSTVPKRPPSALIF